jgi:predicted amidohydrolase
MPRLASCTSAFRDVPDFASFAAHVRELLDRAPDADLVVLPELVTFELMTAVPGWRDATDLAPAIETTRLPTSTATSSAGKQPGVASTSSRDHTWCAATTRPC